MKAKTKGWDKHKKKSQVKTSLEVNILIIDISSLV